MENGIFDAIASLNLSKNERRVVDLIYRCSFGCLNKQTALLIKRDFTTYGLPEPQVKGALEKLIGKNFVVHNYKTGEYYINTEQILAKGIPGPRLQNLLSKNLRNRGAGTYGNSNLKLDESRSSDFTLSPMCSKEGEPKDNKDILNTIQTSSEYKSLKKYLLRDATSINSPDAYLGKIIKTYGPQAINELVTYNAPIGDWIPYLDNKHSSRGP